MIYLKSLAWLEEVFWIVGCT